MRPFSLQGAARAALIATPGLAFMIDLLFRPFGETAVLVIWPRAREVDLAGVVWLALAMAAHVALLAWAERRAAPAGARLGLILAAFMASGLLMQVAATRVAEPFPLRAMLERQYSQFSGGYFSVGARVESVPEFIARYAELQGGFPVHPSSHPPGLPLLFWLGARASEALPGLADALAPTLRPLACFDERAAALDNAQVMAGLLGALIEMALAIGLIVPLFVLVRRAAGPRAALLAAGLYPLTAGMLMWASRFDRVFPWFMVGGLLLCEAALDARSQRRRFSIALGLGLLFGLATFLTFGNLPIMLACGLYFVFRAWQREGFAQWRLRAAQGLTVAAGVALFWLPWLTLGRYDVLASFRYGTGLHFVMSDVRPYFPWVVWHLWDLLTFAGVPFGVIALISFWRHGARTSPVRALGAAFAVPVLGMCAAYIMRDETGRLWMYFMPLIIGLAAIWLAARSARMRWIVIGLAVAQILTQVAMLRVINFGLDPLAVADAALPADLIPTEVRFDQDGQLRLLGYAQGGALKPGEAGSIDLYWKLDAAGPEATSFKIFVHAAETLDDHARVVTQDGKPMNWGLPTTCWRPGMVVRDTHDFTVDGSARPGQYVWLVGLYEETSGARAHVHTAQIAKSGAVQLPLGLTVR